MSRARHSRRPREGVRSRQQGRPGPERSASRWVRWLAPSLVGLLTVLAFLPTAHNQFVSWDDGQTFLENPHYRGLAWPQLRWMWTTFHMGHYSPLTWMTFGADYVLWGMNPGGYHLTSLLLHAATAVAFYAMVLRILTSALPDRIDRRQTLWLAAGFAALLFALHPLRVEAVAWVTGRRDALLGLFSVLTVLAYLRSCERTERGRRWYGLSIALFGCALLSKSMAVSLPVVLLILDVYPLRRLGGSVGWWSRVARRVYLEKVPFVLPLRRSASSPSRREPRSTPSCRWLSSVSWTAWRFRPTG